MPAGGAFYEVERLEDLAGAYERVVADLGTVYSLAYRPSDKTRDGKWRAIRVTVGSAQRRGPRQAWLLRKLSQPS